MRRNQLRFIVLGTFLLGGALVTPRSTAQPALDWFLIDGIGGVSANGPVEIVATISPEDSGFMANGTVSIHSVFEPWPGFSPTPAPVYPSLQVSFSTNHVLIRWPAAFAAQQLEYAPVLVSPGTNWTTVAQAPVTVGAELHMVLPAAGISRFYRLRLD